MPGQSLDEGVERIVAGVKLASTKSKQFDGASQKPCSRYGPCNWKRMGCARGHRATEVGVATGDSATPGPGLASSAVQSQRALAHWSKSPAVQQAPVLPSLTVSGQSSVLTSGGLMLALKEGTTATTGLRLINMVVHASSTALLARAVSKLSIN
ncbi:uncharacterized protein APUU_11813A [Aspergillus puulaauensis]|uniref:Uncharacterized protein n=1 Tax=Aspergillus puulaauensis TaxID=1220207 RepID=A0A7R8AIT2_9EURO|nr:uncharacterized protein APUU_11813A [Aspergillus puulaauensis]BCS18985.1 hypothetical protein APUU_11813A [Aspergillus puulaauensis]